jgi:flagellar FliL protein
MAEEKAKAESAQEAKAPATAQTKPILFIALLVFNMVVVAGVGAMLFLSRKKEAAKPSIEQVVQGEHETQEKEKADQEEEFVGKTIPMETFVVNLAGSRGGKLLKLSLELEVTNAGVMEEIEKRKPQIRDLIIIILSSKTFEQISEMKGKDSLRDELKDTVNSFLTKGQIKRIYFTEFIFS